MSEEQIEIILKETQKLLKVDVYSKVEFRRKKFKNILHWMAYKIGLHCCCYDLSKKMVTDHLAYLEEHVLWSCAAFSDNMNEKKMAIKFENFSNKYLGTLYSSPIEMLEGFMKKIIPNLTKGEFLKITNNFDLHNTDKFNPHKYNTLIFTLLMDYIEAKLKGYFKKCFFFVPGSTSKIQISRSPKKSNFNLFRFPSRASGEALSSKKVSQMKLNKAKSPDEVLVLSLQEVENRKENSENGEIDEFEEKQGNGPRIVDVFKEKYDREPDILKSCFIMENFLEKYVYINKHKIRTENLGNEEEKLLDVDEKKSDEPQNSFYKQKSVTSQNMQATQAVPEPLEKKNSRTKSSKNIKKGKLAENIESLVALKSKQVSYDDERERLKSGFTKREIDEADEGYVNSPEHHKVRKGNESNENKMVMRNEFSNNIQPDWYLSKEIKRSLKNQEKVYKKKRCSCKMFKLDTKACQCHVF